MNVLIHNPEYAQLRNGLIVPRHAALRRRGPTAFDFFAGAGGFSCGLIQAGMTVVGASEWDAHAALTYMLNLGSYPINIHYLDPEDEKRLNVALERKVLKSKNSDNPDQVYQLRTSGSGYIKHHPEYVPVENFWFGDVRKLKGQDILDALGMERGELDCVVGGPPCQGFSRAGQQKIADPRNNLVYEYARLIVELQPKTFVMEEVPDIVNFFDPDGVPVLDKFCLMISEGGYGKWEHVKKAMLMQSGCAAGIRNARGNKPLKKQPAEKNEVGQKTEQIDLFGGAI